MSYLKELQENIEKLVELGELKEAELWLIKNDLQETTKANGILAEQSGLLLDMLDEYLAYVKKNGESEKNKLSKERLLKLLHLNTDLTSLTDQIHSMRLHNKFLISKIVELRCENYVMKHELENIRLAHNGI